MVSKSHDFVDWDDLVPTPGGFQPRRLIFRTKRGESLSVAQWEGAHIVTRTKIDPSATGRIQVVRKSGKLIRTPGGYRHPMLIHHLEAVQGIQVTENGVNIVSNETQSLIKEITIIDRSEYLPVIGKGWIADTYWNNNNGNPISSFTARWKVPDVPRTQSGQAVYLFIGMQYAHQVGPGMVMPVLQWDALDSKVGEKWSVASWYLDPSGIAISTPPIQVNVGEELIGMITRFSQSDGLFTYKVEFQGIADTGLIIPNIPELQTCFIALEAYDIRLCSDFPAEPHTAFYDIFIQAGDMTPELSWTAEDRVIICGQHSVVLSSSNPGSEIDICYY